MPKIFYVTLIRSLPGRVKQLEDSLQALPRTWHSINLVGSWLTFGAYDAAIAYSSESPDDAMNFVVDKLRGFDSVASTETLQGKSLFM